MPGTARVLLRRFTAADLDVLAELNADPQVMRYLGDGRPMSRERVRTQELPRLSASHPGGLGHWAAHRRDDSDFLGWFGAVPTTDPRAVELGYRLRRAMWGNGYAGEGARAMVDAAFAVDTVERVVATTMAVNTASRRVMERAGLRHIRTWFGEWPEYLAGAEHGDVDYALERENWTPLESG